MDGPHVLKSLQLDIQEKLLAGNNAAGQGGENVRMAKNSERRRRDVMVLAEKIGERK